MTGLCMGLACLAKEGVPAEDVQPSVGSGGAQGSPRGLALGLYKRFVLCIPCIDPPASPRLHIPLQQHCVLGCSCMALVYLYTDIAIP